MEPLSCKGISPGPGTLRQIGKQESENLCPTSSRASQKGKENLEGFPGTVVFSL
jgi:hypothetical protein